MVNSPGFDAYYTVSAQGDYAYFVSDKGGMNASRDIFKIALPNEFKPEPVLLVHGNVLNQKTKLPVEARIRVEQLPSGKEEGIAHSNPSDGSYTIVLPRGKKYGFMAEAQGYIPVEENVDLSDIQTYREINRTLYLVPLEQGQTVRLNNLFFEQSKAALLPESFPELERLVEIMQQNPKLEIELVGIQIMSVLRGSTCSYPSIGWRR
ncbi:MAG: hypothetical protein HC842_02010 [Cytophagales bacterium]|nr:hypothetical protein [Cytophagales bacterium]